MPEDKHDIDYIHRPQHDPNSRAVLMGVGIFLFLAAVGFLILIAGFGLISAEQVEPIPTQVTEVAVAVPATATERPALMAPTTTEIPTDEPTPTAIFVTNTPLPTVDIDRESEQPAIEVAEEGAEQASERATQEIIEPTPEVPPVTLPIIEWTEEEKNALSWLCEGEVSGMGSVTQIDACLSVISTIRQRYAYPNGFGETDVISTILRPNQFNVEIRTDEPHPTFYPVVEQYQNGARGSCSGFLFFDSVPGGPSLCRIAGLAGLWIEFHNGWN